MIIKAKINIGLIFQDSVVECQSNHSTHPRFVLILILSCHLWPLFLYLDYYLLLLPLEFTAPLLLIPGNPRSRSTSALSCSFSRRNPSTSTFCGAPKYRWTYSMALAGRCGSSYSPTKALVNESKTPVCSRYFRNSSFLENSLLWLLL
jgi:hypothetical protein